ncbi:MAG TPA: FAD-dependent monooxygenase [Vicinamibacterales bacterium]|nr:FAD-dependent monooxygenase [Vicinamibacterales bacterium]
MRDTDLAIVGSGFGGALLAMIARRLGHRVTLLERGHHPRFAIGESASPLAGILLEQLADRYDLPRVRPLSAFGTWQRTYPQVVCGLKRGFTYFKHETGRQYKADERRTNQLLVAASPSDELSDTHWLRSDVDQFLVNEAIALGVDYHDLVELDGFDWQAGGDPLLTGTRQGQGFRVRAQFVVDASGPRGFLSKALGIADRGFDGYPPTQALFSHFTDVPRCDELEDFRIPNPESRIPDPGSRAPYPIDDAALHHVFDGGWMWVLRFGNGVTSAGVAVEDWLADDLKLAEGEPAWRRLLARYPSIATQFADARPIRSFTWMPRMAYRAAECVGERWAMLPSAAAFIDPLFSTGIPLTLLGIERFAGALRQVGLNLQAGLKTRLYQDATLADADRTARFIAGSYAGFRDFPMFASYSMFYFAAASFSEMARRLDSPRTPRGFLCGDSDRFTAALTRLSPVALRDVAHDRYERDVTTAIADWNVAGLCDTDKKNWYGVDLDDTIRGADKLGLTRKQVRERLGPMACTP